MDKTLETVKDSGRRQYLGRWGIHGVGVRRAENAVCIYLDGGGPGLPDDVRRQIEQEARPFQMLVIEEEQPQVH